MPEHFKRSFAQRLDANRRIRVQEAKDSARILPGHVLIAPGNHDMEVVRDGAEYWVRVFQAEPVGGHRPSVGLPKRKPICLGGAEGVVPMGKIPAAMGR